MKNIKYEIKNYLNMLNNPTVVGFPGDGLEELYDILNSDKEKVQNYDPNFAYIRITLSYLDEISVHRLEEEINEELDHSQYLGKDIYENIKSGYEPVALLEDVEYVEDLNKLADSCDALIKKYKNRLHFVYLIQQPRIFTEQREHLKANSSILDAVIYNKIGESWDDQILTNFAVKQFRKELSTEDISEIAELSGRHYGIFKRLYRDKLLGTDHTSSYIDNLISEFNIHELNLFKKIVSKTKLKSEELGLKKIYEQVGLINNDELAIPILRDQVLKYRIRGKIKVSDDDKRLTGLDLDLLSSSERHIIEHLMIVNEEISRDELADFLWGEDVDDKYSEWAIDKRMSRLRKKLKSLGFNIDVKTVYGRGYKLVKFDN